MGAALAIAADELSARLINGEVPRADRFFESDGEHGSTADEILEGVLLCAGDAYEERKIEYLARLYPGIVFDPTIAPEYGYFLIKTADALTYRQIVFLAHFAGDAEPYPDRRPLPGTERLDEVRTHGSPAGAEVTDLGARGLIVFSGGGASDGKCGSYPHRAPPLVGVRLDAAYWWPTG